MTNVVDAYLKYLERVRLPDDLPDDEQDMHRVMAAYQNRASGDEDFDAWDDFNEIVTGEPDKAWPMLLEVLDRCDDGDLAMIGADAMETILSRAPQKFADRYEEQIRNNDRFMRSFQYVRMTGVPLVVQQQLNAALLDRGVDPKFVVEWDEVVEE